MADFLTCTIEIPSKITSWVNIIIFNECMGVICAKLFVGLVKHREILLQIAYFSYILIIFWQLSYKLKKSDTNWQKTCFRINIALYCLSQCTACTHFGSGTNFYLKVEQMIQMLTCDTIADIKWYNCWHICKGYNYPYIVTKTIYMCYRVT